MPRAGDGLVVWLPFDQDACVSLRVKQVTWHAQDLTERQNKTLKSQELHVIWADLAPDLPSA
jgi:hypothetical protein